MNFSIRPRRFGGLSGALSLGVYTRVGQGQGHTRCFSRQFPLVSTFVCFYERPLFYQWDLTVRTEHVCDPKQKYFESKSRYCAAALPIWKDAVVCIQTNENLHLNAPIPGPKPGTNGMKVSQLMLQIDTAYPEGAFFTHLGSFPQRSIGQKLGNQEI